MYLVAPLDKHFSLLYALLKEHVADDINYKVQTYNSISTSKLKFIYCSTDLRLFLEVQR